MSTWLWLFMAWIPQVVPQSPAAPEATSPPPAFVLREIATLSGVDLVNVCGSHTRKLFIVEQLGSGGALFDYDGDGDPDLYLVNGANIEIANGEEPPVYNALYRNDGINDDGSFNFVDVTQQAGVGDSGWGVGTAVGDIDGDGDSDLYVTNWGRNLLYENQGDGTFLDVSAASGADEPGMGTSASFGDIDGDGDLDLYVVNYVVFDLANPPNEGRPCGYEGLETACGPIGLTAQADRLFRNDGDGKFTDISKISGIHASEPQYSLGVVFGDTNDDGRVDIFVANDSGPNFLFQNQGRQNQGRQNQNGLFEDMAWLSGVATQGEGRFQAGMGVDFGDADGDGRPDLFLTNFANDHNTLYLNQGDDLFQDTSYPSGLGAASRLQMAWGTRFYDLDNDMDQDLYVANGHIYPEVDADGKESFRQPDQLFLNDGRGRFVEASERIERRDASKVSRGVAGADLDLDGDIDLVVFEMGSTPSIYRNDGLNADDTGSAGGKGATGAGNFLSFELRDLANTEGAGARLLVNAGGRIQRREATRGGSYCTSSEARVPFGLGGANVADSVEILWPRGGRRLLRNLASNRRYVVFE